MNTTGRVDRTMSVQQIKAFGVSESCQRLEQYLHQVGYAPGTIQQRMYRLNSLGVPPEEATRDDVLAALPADAKPSTKRVYLSALSASFRDLITMGICDHDPTLGIRIPGFHRGLPRPLPPAVLTALVGAQGTERDWTVMGVYAGLRASDTAALYADDLVETDRGMAISLEGKGGVKALVPAHPLVIEIMQRGRPRGPLWRITPGALSTRWAGWALALVDQRFRYHQCRHSFATRVYEACGQDLLITRDLMRHRSVATTQIYAQADQSRGYRAVAGL